MYTVTVKTEDQSITSTIPVSDNKLADLVSHLMSSPRVRDVHVDEMFDLSFLTNDIIDVVTGMRNTTIDTIISNIDSLWVR